MKVDIKAHTDIGQRTNNQDSYWAANIKISGINGATDASDGAILCVCDGMGGLRDGDYASRTVIEAVRSTVLGAKHSNGTISPELIEEAIVTVNARLFNETEQLNSNLGPSERKGSMGTTCTILILVDGQYRILHVGDSRAYHMYGQGKRAESLTEDQTAFQLYQKRGSLTMTNSQWFYQGEPISIDRVRSYGNKLTNCVGVKKQVSVTHYEGVYTSGDGFLLSSDGFWHRLDKVNGWVSQMLTSDNLGELLSQYVNAFKSYGGSLKTGEKDNQTVVVARVW